MLSAPFLVQSLVLLKSEQRQVIPLSLFKQETEIKIKRLDSAVQRIHDYEILKPRLEERQAIIS